MPLARLRTIRGRLVIWYLAVLAALLAGLGTYQIVTLRDYLRTSLASSMRGAAYAELSVVDPCYVTSSAELRRTAPTVARLLGSHDTAVAIVTPAGAVLANRALPTTGTPQPMKLSQSTIRSLIGSTPPGERALPALNVSACPRPRTPGHHGVFPAGTIHHHTLSHPPQWASSIVSSGGLLLVAVRLGPPGGVAGYAILGRTLEDAAATVARTTIGFVVGAVAVLLIAALVALPIINRALRPLRRVTATAESIAAGNLEERARLAESPDEIGRLGEAFDTMVDRLQAAMSASAESEERMRRFLADASHELRTPVTVLRGASQVLLRQSTAEEADIRAGLRDLHEEAVRLSRLIDDLLTLNRIDMGDSPAGQAVEMRPFLHEFVDHYGVAWPHRTLTVRTDTLNGAAARVDSDALRRIVTNLVDNAARYSRPGGAIVIGGAATAEAVEVSVSDEGPGLSREDAEHVFDRFYRANKSRSRNSGGTGLGLAIVRGLVQGSGGSIEMDTGPDRGTTITVSLPRTTESGSPGS